MRLVSKYLYILRPALSTRPCCKLMQQQWLWSSSLNTLQAMTTLHQLSRGQHKPQLAIVSADSYQRTAPFSLAHCSPSGHRDIPRRCMGDCVDPSPYRRYRLSGGGERAQQTALDKWDIFICFHFLSWLFLRPAIPVFRQHTNIAVEANVKRLIQPRRDGKWH